MTTIEEVETIEEGETIAETTTTEEVMSIETITKETRSMRTDKIAGKSKSLNKCKRNKRMIVITDEVLFAFLGVNSLSINKINKLDLKILLLKGA
jgi:hypothetical protein